MIDVLERHNIRLHPVGKKAKGWGWEPDTQAAIEWLEEHVESGMTVCDIGTGTGILAMVAARRGARVTAYESAEGAFDIAMGNITLNELSSSVALKGDYDGTGGFDLVVANLGDVDYEGMGILAAGKEVWTTPPTPTEAEARQAELDVAVMAALERMGLNGKTP